MVTSKMSNDETHSSMTNNVTDNNMVDSYIINSAWLTAT
jgi:hypothetical protein